LPLLVLAFVVVLAVTTPKQKERSRIAMANHQQPFCAL
jgi:hypothetical protein